MFKLSIIYWTGVWTGHVILRKENHVVITVIWFCVKTINFSCCQLWKHGVANEILQGRLNWLAITGMSFVEISVTQSDARDTSAVDCAPSFTHITFTGFASYDNNADASVTTWVVRKITT